MSKVSIQGDNQGSGTFTIAAPNSNNNRTFSLPDEAGTALTDASDLEPQVKSSLNATGDAPVYACRAWVNFNGEGTVSIRESGNVSSITDISTGEYQINFATTMPDANYVAMLTTRDEGDFGSYAALRFAETPNTSQFRVQNITGDQSYQDTAYFHVTIFR